MPDPGPAETSDRERRIEEIIADFLAAEDQGQPLALEAILAQHPDLVDELRAFFKDHDRIGSLAAPLRAVALAGSAAAETTYVGSDSALAASRQPIDLRDQSTEILTATNEPSTKWASRPERDGARQSRCRGRLWPDRARHSRPLLRRLRFAQRAGQRRNGRGL